MNKKDLEKLVQECIFEVVAEGYDEFQRVDKGSKGVAAKNKAEEDTYGAGYAAGEKAAKSKYKKLAEAYKQLKEEGFGIGPKGLEVSDDVNEVSQTQNRLSSDAQAVINLISKQPMLLQKLSLIADRRELEDIFNYLITRLNPQFAKNTTGIRTAANNAAQKVAKDEEKLNELSPELRKRAYDTAMDKADNAYYLNKGGDWKNDPLEKQKRLSQATTFGRTVNPDVVKKVKSIIGPDYTVKITKAVDKVYLDVYDKKTDTTSKFEIVKDEYKIPSGGGIPTPDLGRKIKNVISLLQQKELT
jgi:hypothetical protein